MSSGVGGANSLPSTSAGPDNSVGAPASEKPKVEKPEQGPDANDPYLRLRVINSDRSNEVHFRIKYEVQMIRMKRAYSTRMGLNADELRFVFEGVRITDYDTAKSLGMANEDVIEVYQERIGGM